MWRNFCVGFLDGIVWMIVAIAFLVFLTICAMPFVLALMYSNAWWLLAYILIIPVVLGVYNVLDNILAR